jgi:hypothetical protein
MILIDGYLVHCMLRAAERYGLEIDMNEYTALSAKIAAHEKAGQSDCVRLCHAARGREKWALWYKGEWIPLVFDPAQARIVTFLPKLELRPFLKRLPW